MFYPLALNGSLDCFSSLQLLLWSVFNLLFFFSPSPLPFFLLFTPLFFWLQLFPPSPCCSLPLLFPYVFHPTLHFLPHMVSCVCNVTKSVPAEARSRLLLKCSKCGVISSTAMSSSTASSAMLVHLHLSFSSSLVFSVPFPPIILFSISVRLISGWW